MNEIWGERFKSKFSTPDCRFKVKSTPKKVTKTFTKNTRLKWASFILSGQWKGISLIFEKPLGLLVRIYLYSKCLCTYLLWIFARNRLHFSIYYIGNWFPLQIEGIRSEFCKRFIALNWRWIFSAGLNFSFKKKIKFAVHKAVNTSILAECPTKLLILHVWAK